MFDSLFNILIVLIPLAIFIGRSVSRARARQTPPPPPPRIPVHFEDDDDDYEYEFYAGKAEGSAAVAVPAPRPAPRTVPKSVASMAPAFSETPSPGQSRTDRGNLMPVPEQKPFQLNLAYLSPMQQAVVMAEVLGPPKSLI